MALLQRAIDYIKIRMVAAAVWQTSTDEMWREHIDYILGERVRGASINDISDKPVKAPIGALLRAGGSELCLVDDEPRGRP